MIIGSNVKTENKGSSKNIWNEVEEKIQGALNIVEFDYTFDKRGDEAETSGRMHPLSLLAIDESPRLRLLSTTLKQLRKMVGLMLTYRMHCLHYMYYCLGKTVEMTEKWHLSAAVVKK